MRPIINADDYGLSPGINDTILDAFDHGALSSVSIIPNGEAFDTAIAEYKKRKGLRLAIHLNLIEGRALLPAQEIPQLVHPNGTFRRSFQSLVFGYLFGNAQTRYELKSQVQKEITAQIEKVAAILGEKQELRIDSHQHTHLIPFIFDALLELHPRFHFSYIRIPKEPFFMAYDGVASLKNYAGSNIIKHVLLNFLSRRPLRKLQEQKIGFPRCFLGVLFTGNMRQPIVEAALKTLERKCGENEIAEIVLHPGGAAPGEEAIWQNSAKEFGEFYYSPWRKREREILKSQDFKKLWKRYNP